MVSKTFVADGLGWEVFTENGSGFIVFDNSGSCFETFEGVGAVSSVGRGEGGCKVNPADFPGLGADPLIKVSWLTTNRAGDIFLKTRLFIFCFFIFTVNPRYMNTLLDLMSN